MKTGLYIVVYTDRTGYDVCVCDMGAIIHLQECTKILVMFACEKGTGMFIAPGNMYLTIEYVLCT